MKEKLVAMRKKANLSQTDVAKRLNITSSALNQYEKGKRKPSFDVLVRLAEIYECNIQDFV